METRLLLPGRRMCLCQEKGAGGETCGEEMKMRVRWEHWGVTGSLVAFQPFLEGVQSTAGTLPTRDDQLSRAAAF